jgi:hypothetical protein
MSNQSEDDFESGSWSLNGKEPYNNFSLDCNIFSLKEINHNNVTTTVVLQTQLESCTFALLNVLLIRKQIDLPQENNGKICKPEIVHLLENFVEDVLETNKPNYQNFDNSQSMVQSTIYSLLSKDANIDQ